MSGGAAGEVRAPGGGAAAAASRMVCGGCGTEAPEPSPFRCPRAGRPGDDVDHVLGRVLDLRQARWPDGAAPGESEETGSFVRWRTFSHAWHLGRAHGLPDEEIVRLVQALDAEVAAVDGRDGRGFVVTPFAPEAALAGRVGLRRALWVKDETGNVSGSHKGRHLMGVMIWLEVARRAGVLGGERPPLAIASCGNAALAAAVVARAARWPLRVFVPVWASPAVVARLEALGAETTVCRRAPGVAGDPCTHAFRAAVREGAVPFSCQGPDAGLAIEGGMTLGFEMVEALAGSGAVLDRLFIQVGGGALASACIQAFREARALGHIARLPRIHAVQTEGGHPLARAWDRIVARAGGRGAEAMAGALAHAAAHRSAYMWPWETEPRSLAHGILDDETYDWLAIARGMAETDGHPVVVPESLVQAARDLGREATAIRADATGTAGLAGLLHLRAAGTVGEDENVAVLFTGAERASPGAGAREAGVDP